VRRETLLQARSPDGLPGSRLYRFPTTRAVLAPSVARGSRRQASGRRVHQSKQKKGQMKVKTHFVGITGACAALTVALALPASAADTGLYFNADAGINWAQDADIDLGGGLSGDLKLDTGFRFSAGVGYNFNKNWGVEFDTGWVWNSIDKIKIGSFSQSFDDSSFSHLPFIVNAVYRYQFGAKYETYIGAGIGGVYSSLTIDDQGVDDDDGDVVFAWQAIAGVRYLISETMSVGVGYKYLGTTEGKYDIEGSSIKIDSVHNHTFGAVFNWKF
jgi:opacity protein-like surface antigen